ncbi:tetratricopeptide repeat protein [Roseovarius sp. SCSIO 43702]|uniref:tetratricopeptide repeat protein n=1 Tax=Roseovarius sp. SCSIO 43702 TaxID=2823043 RepID=UPI001C73D9A2|nr:tetratricopeptide repeat protein [Roseovarius sp. SCSIO 43702]QYX55833.1 tetratricopeptide repeat protein [Roseovarius sp. SCSIO 43702]
MSNRFLVTVVTALSLVPLSGTASAEVAPGAYLAARQARYNSDYAAAAEYLTQALLRDPENAELLDHATAAFVSLGRIRAAIPIARRIEELELQSQIANMTLVADLIKEEDYDSVIARVEEDRAISPLADGLLAAWAHLGKGDMSTALGLFDAVMKEPGMSDFAAYHKALALGTVGDFEGTVAIFSGDAVGEVQTTRRGAIAWAEALSQLERNEDAIKVIDDTFGKGLDPELADLRARLEAEERVPFSRVSGATDGVAEVLYSLGRALLQETSSEYVLVYSRLAEYLSPDHIDAQIMSAELLEDLGRYELATEAYARVPRDHPSFHVAEIGRAETLRRSGRLEAAAEVLNQLTKSHPNQPVVHVSAGDLFRQLEEFDKAVDAYDRAVEIYEEQDEPQWFVHYTRAISYERQGKWPEAEADFRRALELNPEQPEVLNYLGYSLVEKRQKLDEALDMIERAVEQRPESGAIQDSYGWALYRLGRYDEAVGPMETAASLSAVDPVINDHLGDVLWAVGRRTEAEFQWKRALSFITEDTPEQDIDPERIRRKLEVGLDEVLAEEGAAPIAVADDDG